MEKIKYINCFGTSYTAGGGFEFMKSDIELNKVYKNINLEKTQYNFSWPGQLQKLLKDKDIKVNNYAKSGYGNDRLYRLSYDLINSKDFKPAEHLFIFEFSGIGRDEFYYNKIDDYIVCNYQIFGKNNEYNYKFVGSAKSYKYDNKKTRQLIEDSDEFFEKYVNDFVDINANMNKMIQNSDFFLSYLEKNKINFVFSLSPILNYEYDNNRKIKFGDGYYFAENVNFVEFINQNNLTITDETNGMVSDGHGGFKANNIISKCVYNKLVDFDFINSKKLEIDWKWYLENNFI